MPNPPQRLSAHSPQGGPVDSSTAIHETFGLVVPKPPQRLLIATIRRDPALQSRATFSEETAQEYAEAMQAGAKFPPGVVYDDGETKWLVEGWHRVRACEINGTAEFEFEVRQGSRREALQHSLGVNDKHGLRRTNEDKRRAVGTALSDHEWGQMSSREIAQLCAVSHVFVETIRRSVETVTTERKSREKKAEIRKTADGRQIKVKNKPANAAKKGRQSVPKPDHKPTAGELPEYIIHHLTLAAQGLNQIGAGNWAESVFSFIEQVKEELAYQIRGDE